MHHNTWLGIFALLVALLFMIVMLSTLHKKHKTYNKIVERKLRKKKESGLTLAKQAPQGSRPKNKYVEMVLEGRKKGKDVPALLHQAAMLPLSKYEKPYEYLDYIEWPNFEPSSLCGWGPPPGVSKIDASVVPW